MQWQSAVLVGRLAVVRRAAQEKRQLPWARERADMSTRRRAKPEHRREADKALENSCTQSRNQASQIPRPLGPVGETIGSGGAWGSQRGNVLQSSCSRALGCRQGLPCP